MAGSVARSKLQDVLDLVVEQAYDGLQRLTDSLPEKPDADRRQEILLWLHITRQRLLRLLELLSWSSKARACMECIRILEVAGAQLQVWRDTANQMGIRVMLERQLFFRAVPLYDVSTALDIETQGRMPLPSCLQRNAFWQAPTPVPKDRKAAVRHLNTLTMSHLLKADIPAGLTVEAVQDGCAVLQCERVYEAKLMLEPASALASPQPAAAPGSATAAEVGSGEAATESAAATPAAPVAVPAAEPEQPSWRWRLMNLAVQVGSSGPKAVMTLQQLQQLQHFVDLRMQQHRDSAVLKLLSSGGPTGVGGSQGAGPAPPSDRHQEDPASAAANAEGTEACATDSFPCNSMAEAGNGLQLRVLHTMVLDTCQRLLSLCIRSRANAFRASSQLWSKNLSVDAPTVLDTFGTRLCYWGKAPFALPRDLEGEEAAYSSASQPPVVQPAVEVGVDRQACRLQLLQLPSLDEHLPAGMLGEDGRLPLALDSAELRVQDLLLQAAAAAAVLQLRLLNQAVQAALKQKGASAAVWALLNARLELRVALPPARRRRRRANRSDPRLEPTQRRGSDTPVHHPAGGASTSGLSGDWEGAEHAVSSQLLFRVRGRKQLSVGVNLVTGLLLVRSCGPALRQLGAHTAAKIQAQLQQGQRLAREAAAPGAAMLRRCSVALLEALTDRLLEERNQLLLRISARAALTRPARQLSQAALQSFLLASPATKLGLPAGSLSSLMLQLCSFAPLEVFAPGAPAAPAAGQVEGSSLAFFLLLNAQLLMARLTTPAPERASAAAMPPAFALVVAVRSKEGVPSRILHLVPMPPSALQSSRPQPDPGEDAPEQASSPVRKAETGGYGMGKGLCLELPPLGKRSRGDGAGGEAPRQLLQNGAVPKPEAPVAAAPNGAAPSAPRPRPPEATNGGLAPPSPKRRRRGARQDGEDVDAPLSASCSAAGEGGGEEDVLPSDRVEDLTVQLKAAARWARTRSQFEAVRVGLQLLGVRFRVQWPRRPRQRRGPLPEGDVQRCRIHLLQVGRHSFPEVRGLDSAGAAKPEPGCSRPPQRIPAAVVGVTLTLLEGGGGHLVWVLEVRSAYLRQLLQRSAAGGAAGGWAASEAGVQRSYPVSREELQQGGRPWAAAFVRDTAALLRARDFSCALQLMAPAHVAGAGLSFAWPDTGALTVARIGLISCTLLYHRPAGASAGFEPQPLVEYVVSWSGRSAGRSSVSDPRVRCHVSASRNVAAGALAEMAAMAEAGEVELFLDALAIGSWPLVALAEATAAPQLLGHNLPVGLTETCRLTGREWPYWIQLESKGEAVLEVQLLASSYTWLGFSKALPAPQLQAALQQRLGGSGSVWFPEEAPAAPRGVWLHNSVLGEALGVILVLALPAAAAQGR